MKFINLIPITKEEIQKTREQLNHSASSPWDPVEQIDVQRIADNVAKLLTQYEYLKEHPSKPNNQFLLALLFGIVFGGGTAYFIISSSGISNALFVSILCLFPVLYVHSFYKTLGKDLIKIQLAKENDWFYDPKEYIIKWKNLKQYYPELFDKGNRNQNIEDQFWGEIKKENKTFKFYSGVFKYTVKSGKHSVTYTRNFFCIKLNKELKSKFMLTPETSFSKIGNVFTGKEINTESTAFNETFAFSYNGSRGEKAQEIVKTLSPVVQNKLVDLSKSREIVAIEFSHNCVFFIFNNLLLGDTQTSFTSSIEIAKEDVKKIRNQLEELTTISSDIAKYLD